MHEKSGRLRRRKLGKTEGCGGKKSNVCVFKQLLHRKLKKCNDGKYFINKLKQNNAFPKTFK